MTVAVEVVATMALSDKLRVQVRSSCLDVATQKSVAQSPYHQ